jgi:hypothetical protein
MSEQLAKACESVDGLVHRAWDHGWGARRLRREVGETLKSAFADLGETEKLWLDGFAAGRVRELEV